MHTIKISLYYNLWVLRIIFNCYIWYRALCIARKDAILKPTLTLACRYIVMWQQYLKRNHLQKEINTCYCKKKKSFTVPFLQCSFLGTTPTWMHNTKLQTRCRILLLLLAKPVEDPPLIFRSVMWLADRRWLAQSSTNGAKETSGKDVWCGHLHLRKRRKGNLRKRKLRFIFLLWETNKELIIHTNKLMLCWNGTNTKTGIHKQMLYKAVQYSLC